MTSLRFLTAASLFDGHDVSINIIRRMLQSFGAEVIHLGHNRSALDVVKAALEEDVNAVALSSYQGGHVEYFSYIRQLLDENGGKNIRIFGGGGGVIIPSEIELLEKKGITRIYTPEDGATLGLEGIIKDMLQKATHDVLENVNFTEIQKKSDCSNRERGQVLSYIERNDSLPFEIVEKKIPVLGITGTGGAGKSSLIDEILLRLKIYTPEKNIALVSFDPARKRGVGTLLGDRIRLGQATHERFFIRSMSTRGSESEVGPTVNNVISYLKSLDYDLIIIETSGIGQASDEITKYADISLYVMTPEYGSAGQLEKIEMLGAADFVVLNKFEKIRSEDALRDIRKQYRRNKALFDMSIKDEDLPIYGTVASQHNDSGVNALFCDLLKKLSFSIPELLLNVSKNKASQSKHKIIQGHRVQYLGEIARGMREYNLRARKTAEELDRLQSFIKVSKEIQSDVIEEKVKEGKKTLEKELQELEHFQKVVENYQSSIPYTESLSGIRIPKVSLPRFSSLGDSFLFMKSQNLPGHFPYAAGVFPFKRTDEDPKRQFAGEGGPLRTNERFHYLTKDDDAKRLSTAFDSVTLYGEDPAKRPDIYGKIGESGVSIATLDDMEDLFKGLDLINPKTSVSMTINGPAPIMLAMFMNAAIRQKYSGDDVFDKEKRLEVIKQVRGTVQADILKEDQAQNTCIFSLNFSLKMMGDVQEFFCKNKIKNYYTVSISGYHIAEAGANPITQLAFTLANGLTYVEYYLGRGMKIDDICQNLSFFFSNGLDPEYSVLGRVARKIWAVTMRDIYQANEKSQRLKYHIQTSGRSLHAQEIQFNDIRTTLQAYLALSDNCNSLHTNAYDEAITTPTEESVRRAMAIQLIINREFGLQKCDNPLQGSFIMDELADLVEEAVLTEFERLSERGGTLGAMESQYQRSKIQDESMYYEHQKDSGKLPIIGVNTFLSKDDEESEEQIPITRASYDEKDEQIRRLDAFKNKNKKSSKVALEKLKEVVLKNENIFEELLDTVQYCSLGEITQLLYSVGGSYRRNM